MGTSRSSARFAVLTRGDMLYLPDVTLITTANVCHDLAREAMADTASKIRFAEMISFSDRPLGYDGERWVEARWPDSYRCMQYLWTQASKAVATKFMLYLQWDSGIVDVTKWDSEWLTVDYVGAPWPHPNLQVGNGGFSIRSTRLMNFLATHQDLFECPPIYEDSVLSKQYRSHLESYGFRWAPLESAERFAFELRKPPPGGTFAYHGIFNWPKLLSEEEQVRRYRMFDAHARSSPTLRKLPQHLLRQAGVV